MVIRLFCCIINLMMNLKIVIAPFVFLLTSFQQGLSLINIWPWLHGQKIHYHTKNACDATPVTTIAHTQLNTMDTCDSNDAPNAESIDLPEHEDVYNTFIHFYAQYFPQFEDKISDTTHNFLHKKKKTPCSKKCESLPSMYELSLCIFLKNWVKIQETIKSEIITTLDCDPIHDSIKIMKTLLTIIILRKIRQSKPLWMDNLELNHINLILQSYEYSHPIIDSCESLYQERRSQNSCMGLSSLKIEKVGNSKKLQENKKTEIEKAIQEKPAIKNFLIPLAFKWGLTITNDNTVECSYILPDDEDPKITQLRIALLKNIFCDPQKFKPPYICHSNPSSYSPDLININLLNDNKEVVLHFGYAHATDTDFDTLSIRNSRRTNDLIIFKTPNIEYSCSNRILIKALYQKLIEDGYTSIAPIDHLTPEQKIALSICIEKEDNSPTFLTTLQKKLDIVNTLKTTPPIYDNSRLAKFIITYLQQEANQHWIAIHENNDYFNWSSHYQAKRTHVIIDHPFYFKKTLHNKEIVYMSQGFNRLKKVGNYIHTLFSIEQRDEWGNVITPIDTSSYKIYQGTLYSKTGMFKITKTDKNYHRPYLQIEFMPNG